MSDGHPTLTGEEIRRIGRLMGNGWREKFADKIPCHKRTIDRLVGGQLVCQPLMVYRILQIEKEILPHVTEKISILDAVIDYEKRFPNRKIDFCVKDK